MSEAPAGASGAPASPVAGQAGRAVDVFALEAAGLKGRRLLEALREGSFDLEPYREAATAVLDAERRLGFSHLSLLDEDYPPRLKDISSPPPLLRVLGDVACLSDRRLVAVAGTREPSAFGVSATRAVVEAVASRGFGVVSGLAKGVDAEAHRAALSAGVKTIAVLGSGLDKLYPKEHRSLAEDIVAAGGALVSEVAAGTTVSPRHLIARNRLQTGLSVALFVGQTGRKGGTLHTVRFALEQGRPVWCPKPQAPHPRSEGLSVLLEGQPADLAELAAFAQAKRLLAELPERPVAKAVTRETLPDLVAELERLVA